jgi:hypothetical protein
VTIESALHDLESQSPIRRARGAAALAADPSEFSTAKLIQLLQLEPVPQIRAVIMQTLKARSASPRANSELRPALSEESEHELARVQELPGGAEAAALIRHELSPPIGWIRLAANEEVDNYASSATADALERLQRRVAGLIAYLSAQHPSNFKRVDLTEALHANWPDPFTYPDFIQQSEPGPLPIDTDEGLLALLLANVYQNAIDAQRNAASSKPVQVAYGHTRDAYWVRIINVFKGARFEYAELEGVGSTSQASHQGLGLATIRNAASQLGIVVTLIGDGGVATFTLSGKLSKA